jgi:hypothetical protein
VDSSVSVYIYRYDGCKASHEPALPSSRSSFAKVKKSAMASSACCHKKKKNMFTSVQMFEAVHTRAPLQPFAFA